MKDVAIYAAFCKVATTDPDRNPLPYAWAVTQKTELSAGAVLSDSKILTPTFTPDRTGTYWLTLTPAAIAMSRIVTSPYPFVSIRVRVLSKLHRSLPPCFA